MTLLTDPAICSSIESDIIDFMFTPLEQDEGNLKMTVVSDKA
jgi:hypothetical protein